MLRLLRYLILATLLAAAPAARATFHIVTIDEIYSNADGSVQYMVLLGRADQQNELSGHAIVTVSPGGPTNFVFPNNIHSSATNGKRILVATQGFAALNLVTPDYTVPNGFFPLASATVNYAGADQWSYAALPTDGANALFANGMTGPNLATNFAGVSASVTPAASVVNYQGLWWKPDEPFWGVNLAHQGDQVFATWYTYDTSGNAYWLSMLAGRTTPASNAYNGPIFVDTGPPFNNFNTIGMASQVGTGTLTFSDADNGTLAYTVTAGGATNVQQNKPITRFSLGGAQPTCTYASAPNLAAATNYQDLWWLGPTESGWGINFAHQGNQLFATWYTYDAKTAGGNPPLWLSALMARQGATNVFTGPLTRTAGPRFDNYKASDVVQPIPTVGTATVTFADGNHATFAYTTNGTGGLPVSNQSKSITRTLFAGPAGTPCN
jgi:hypothetical protein